MAFTHSDWNKTGCTASADGTLTEDTNSNRHSFYQDIQSLIDTEGLGTSAILKAKVTPIGRTRAWIGCRQNNGFFQQTFLLTGSGSIETSGSNVTSATIDANGDGSYTCKVVYSGTFSSTNTVFAVGAMISDNTQTYTGTGIAAIKVEEPQLIKGTTDIDFVSTDDRTIYYDSETGDGSQDATMPASNKPSQIEPLFISSTGSDELTISDFTYDADDLTVSCLVDWNGNTSAVKTLAKHWDGSSQNAWKAYLTTDGKFTVDISDDGSTTDKSYVAVKALDTDEKTLCSFTWDGTDLKLYYNDIELTTAAGELTKTTDNAISGDLHNSTDSIRIGDDHYGKYYEFRIYDGAATGAEIASIASGFGVSGLPDGTTPGGGGGGDLPSNAADMIQWIKDQGYLDSDIFYINNSTGSDSNSGTSSGDAWATIGKAASNLTAGQAVFISGAGGRFYEQVTPQNSGSSGNRIMYVGDPDNPCIIDSSELFTSSGGSNWTSEGGGMYSASYSATRYFSDEAAYFAQSPGTGLVPLSTFMTHQVIYNDAQLVRKSTSDHTVEPSSMEQGECWFKTTGSSDSAFKSPTEVWVRLPGDIDPDTVDMRIGSDKKYLFDWHANTWEEGFPGANDNGSGNASGRDHLALINIHLKFGCCIRKRGPLSIRGTGWWLRWCSISDSNAYSFTIYGTNHTVENCKFINSGCGPARMEYCQNTSGTTLLDKCLYKNDNIHSFPESWDAGFKISHSGDGGTTKWTNSHWYQSGAVGIWWDIFNGDNNGTGEAFLVEHCIFEEQGRHGIFVEHNSENVVIKHCGIWKTKLTQEGNHNHKLGTGVRIAGAGLCTFENNAIVQNDGIGWYSKAGQDGRGPNNQDTIRNNVFINNNQDGTHDIDRCEFFGGDDVDEPGTYPWSSSTIDDNVFFNTLPSGVNYFVEANTNSGWVANDTISWFEDSSRTNGSGNAIAASAAAVVQDETDRKEFYVTVGSYTSKGPQSFTHYEDFTDTGWTIPS